MSKRKSKSERQVEQHRIELSRYLTRRGPGTGCVLPSVERLNELLDYDPNSGVLLRKGACPGPKPTNKASGHKEKQGFIRLSIDGKRYLSHRVIWKLVTGQDPSGDIDHRDGNPSNNAWCNLRLAEHQQNCCNRRGWSKHGTKGVSPLYREGKMLRGKKVIRGWRSHIRHHGKLIHLGNFKTKEDAHSAYQKAAADYHKDFARNG